MTIGLDPNLLSEYWIGETQRWGTHQFIRSPSGDDYLLIEEDEEDGPR